MVRSSALRLAVVASVLAACAAPGQPSTGGSLATPEPSAQTASTPRQAPGSHIVPARVQRTELDGGWAASGPTPEDRVRAFLAARQGPLALRGDLRVVASENDDLTGRTIVRTQQIIDGLAVDGHTLLVTLEGDRVVSVRGYKLDVTAIPAREVGEADAVDIAVVHAGLGTDRATAEASGVTIATEEVLREMDGAAYRAWKVTLETMVTKPVVYVDAVTGDVVFETNLVRHAVGSGRRMLTDDESFVGTTTLPTVAIDVSSSSSGYRLHTGTAASFVWTMNSTLCRGGTQICGTEVTSASTDFGSTDPRYTTSHYYLGRLMTFLADYGLNSYDNKGAGIRNFTLNSSNKYDNAFYGGKDYIVLGDGSYDGSAGAFQPLVFADVIFHEMGHAVDAKSGGNFEYTGESGALSESWADMQGYRGREVVLPDTAAHTLGADFVPGNWHNEEACGTSGILPASSDCGACNASANCGDGACSGNEVCEGAGLASPAVECPADCGTCSAGPGVVVGDTDAAGRKICDRGKDIAGDNHHAYLRNLADPKQAHQPDTYGGEYWVPVTGCSSSNDYCGVHTNSGVGNRWFTLVALGGSGTNDASVAYSVAGVGSDAAYRIALRAVDLYSTSTDKYADFARSTVTAATDLYGASNPAAVSAVTAAWSAVNVTPAAAPPPPPPPPTCGAVGTTCTSGSQCCSGSCGGKPGKKTCK